MTTKKPSALETEITNARRTISTDGYPMSIGELTNLYKEGELIIRPEFQRFFRWTESQKSMLIESILLGIPIPSIFVSQSETGKWEVVDGLQRISTILQLQGELIKDGAKQPPLILQGTKYLPALENRSWESNDPKFALTEAQKLDVKRSKLDLKIIKRESSVSTKFDLFQRLNSYGSSLNSQEMRSALLVAISSNCFAWIEKLASDPNFVQCTQLSDRLIEERYDLELVIRFLVLHNRPSDRVTLTSLRDLPQVLDKEAMAIAERFPKGKRSLESIFTKTFSFIAKNGGDLIFKRWDPAKKEFRGSFLNTSFEVFALGVGFHVANGTTLREDLLASVKEFWCLPVMSSGFATGRSTEARLAEFMPLGRNLLSND
ncbi:DUF262 domain-containing protein [Burkholderia ambifaria]|uniref:DUF262 domain-containing protein n=1 Tax=Burkholderia ambifaria TaxID=152480 RepID=UPI001589FE81|nr:DUF262 domain-containing protein [Burkholderia ambifaria]QQJ99495.1 DUF262 domain-containing protein [Burkholderia ambifaria]